MRNVLAASIMALAAWVAFPPMARAQSAQPPQGSSRQEAPTRAVQNGDAPLYASLEGEGPGGPAPRRSLSGTWAGPGEAEATRAVPALTPLGEKRMSVNKPESKFRTSGTNDPWFTTCDPLGFPRSIIDQTRGIAFGEMPGRILILDQYNRVWREVWMDGRALPKNVGSDNGPDPRWFGYSVGHWDGDDTLVVQTTGSDERSWIDKLGHPHSADAVVEERYTRPDHNDLEVTISIDDPNIYSKPYVAATNKFKWIPDQDFEEQICVPSEGIQYQKLIGVPAGDGSSPKN